MAAGLQAGSSSYPSMVCPPTTPPQVLALQVSALSLLPICSDFQPQPLPILGPSLSVRSSGSLPFTSHSYRNIWKILILPHTVLWLQALGEQLESLDVPVPFAPVWQLPPADSGLVTYCQPPECTGFTTDLPEVSVVSFMSHLLSRMRRRGVGATGSPRKVPHST